MDKADATLQIVPSVNGVYKLPVTAAKVSGVDVIDVDLVIRSSDGRTFVLPNGALEAVSGTANIVSTTGRIDAKSLMAKVGPVEVPQQAVPALSSAPPSDQHSAAAVAVVHSGAEGSTGTESGTNSNGAGQGGAAAGESAPSQAEAALLATTSSAPIASGGNVAEQQLAKASQLLAAVAQESVLVPSPPNLNTSPAHAGGTGSGNITAVPSAPSLGVSVGDIVSEVVNGQLLAGRGNVALGALESVEAQSAWITVNGSSGTDAIRTDISAPLMNGTTLTATQGAVQFVLDDLGTPRTVGAITVSLTPQTGTTLNHSYSLEAYVAGQAVSLSHVGNNWVVPESVIDSASAGSAGQLNAVTLALVYGLETSVPSASFVDDRFTLSMAQSMAFGDSSQVYTQTFNVAYVDPSNTTMVNSLGGDLLLFGQALPVVVNPGAGTHVIDLGPQVNMINAGTGNDTIIAGGGVNSVIGGTGQATIDYVNSPSAVTVDLAVATDQSGGYATGNYLSNVNGVIGSAYNDLYIAGSLAASFTGGGGSATVSYIHSTAGVTVNLATGIGTGGYAQGDHYTDISNVVGSPYNDLFIAGTLPGSFVGGGGSDTVSYVDSNAAVTVNLATNTGVGGYAQGDHFSGVSELIGSGNNGNTLIGNGNVTLYGGTGLNNYLDGGGANSWVDYRSVTTGLTVNLAAGATSGGATDTLVNIENVLGGAGNDTIVANDAMGTVNGEGGVNWLNLSQLGHGVTINLGQSTLVESGVSGTKGVFNIEGVTGTSYGDTFIGGGAGVETFLGGSGDDTFVVGTGGVESIVGGSGVNFLDFSQITTGLTASLSAAGGGTWVINGETVVYNAIDGLIAPDYASTFTGNGADDSLLGGSANDTFIAAISGTDRVDGEGGINFLQFTQMTTGLTATLAASGGTIVAGSETVVYANIEGLIAPNYASTLTGAGTGESLVGGSANDTFVAASTGIDHVDGMGGVNFLDFASATAGLTADLATAAGTLSVGSETVYFANIEGLIAPGYASTLTGNGTLDSLIGGVADDTFIAAVTGKDYVNGEGGTNFLDFASATVGLTASLSAGAGTIVIGTETVVYANIEGLIAPNTASTLTGDGSGDSLIGGSSNDKFILAGGGSDTVDGGGGFNVLDFANATVGLTANLLSAGGTITIGGETVVYANIEGLIAPNYASTLAGNGGNDSLVGGSANNTFIVASSGNDTVTGGSGVNFLDFANMTVGLTASLTGTSGVMVVGGEVVSFANIEGLIAPDYASTLTGNGRGDSLVGGVADDTFALGIASGSDTVNGMGGTNFLDFSEMSGGLTASLSAGTGTVIANGDTVTYTNIEGIIAPNAASTLTGGGTGGTLIGGGANDTFIVATSGMDSVDGEGGTNFLDFAQMSLGLTTAFTEGSGTLTIGSETVVYANIEGLIAPNAASTITGNGGGDSLVGGSGNDTFVVAASGSDTVNGEGGINFLDFVQLGAGLTGSLVTGSGVLTVGGETVVYSNIEGLIAPNYDSTLTGDGHTDTLIGGSGNDTFIPAATGTDHVDGEGGINFLDLAKMTSGLTAALSASGGTLTAGGETVVYANIEGLIAPNYASTLTGNGSTDSLIGGSAADTFFVAASGTDFVDGEGGNNVLDFVNLTTGLTATLVAAGGTITTAAETVSYANIEALVAPNYASTLTGSGTGDTLQGGSANDTFIPAVNGNDTVNGEGGVNFLDFAQLGVGLTASLVASGGTLSANGVTVVYSNIEGLIAPDIASTLTGNGAGESLVGGAANDTFIAAASGSDYVDGEGGVNFLDFAKLTGGLTATLVASGGTISANGETVVYANIEGLIAPNHASTLTGDGAGDTLLGGSANDTLIVALSGSDTVDGEGGVNFLDFANMTSGLTAAFAGGSGSITVGGETVAYANIEGLIAPNFASTLTGAGTGESLVGGSANDTFIPAVSGTDSINGEGGVNFLDFAQLSTGLTATLVAAGGTLAANGVTVVYANIEGLIAPNTASTLTGDGAGDSLVGGSGNDTFVVGVGGSDTVDGEGGINFISFAGMTAGLTAALAASSSGSVAYTGGGSGTIAYANIEGVIAPNFASTITGSGGGESLIGGTGNDTFILTGGSNYVDGEAGSNWVNFAQAASGITVNLSTGSTSGGASDTLANIESVVGSPYNDTIIANDALNTVDGGAGVNLLNLSALSDGVTLNLKLGTMIETGISGTKSVLNIENVVGSNNGDTLIAGTGNETFWGGSGTNTFEVGAGGIDSMVGGTGVNFLSFQEMTAGLVATLGAGGAGSVTYGSGTVAYANIEGLIAPNFVSTLTGNGSSDSLVGGSANDTFLVNGGTDHVDGEGGINVLDFAGLTIGLTASLSALGGSITYTGTSVGTVTYANIEELLAPNAVSTLTGGGNSDTLIGGSASDTFIVFSGGADYVNGEGGTNILSFAGMNAGLVATLSATGSGSIVYAGSGGTGTVTYANIEGLIAPNIGSTLTGLGTGEYLYGGSANDTLVVGSGGADHVDGEAGINFLSFASMTTGLTAALGVSDNGSITYSGGGGTGTVTYANIEGIIAPNYASTLTGNGTGDSLIGGSASNNTFLVTGGLDYVNGGSGTTEVLSFQGASNAVVGTLSATGGTLSYGSNKVTYVNIEEVIASNTASTLTGDGVSDTLIGGTANDTLIVKVGGTDHVDGGAGVNLLSFQGATGGITATLSSTGGTIQYTGSGGAGTVAYVNIEALQASNVVSTLTGDGAADSLLGGTANDTFFPALTGTDYVNGEGGINFLDFASMTTGLTATLVSAGGTITAGGDTVTYANIEGVLAPNTASTLTGDGVADSLIGGSANDTFIVGSGGTDYVNGEGGINFLSFAKMTTGLTAVLGASGTGSITYTGGGSATVTYANIEGIVAPNYASTITGNGLGDSLLGGTAGNDTFLPATSGSDYVNGGSGTSFLDFVNFSSLSAGLTATLASTGGTITAGTETVTYANIHGIITAPEASTVTVTAGTDTVVGTHQITVFPDGGTVYVNGASAYETTSTLNLSLSTGADTVFLGNETVNGVSATSLSITLASGYSGFGTGGYAAGMQMANIENVVGGNHGDSIVTNANNDTVIGGSGINTIFVGFGGNDYVDGGSGDDSVLSFAGLTTALNITAGASGTITYTGGTVTFVNIEGIQGSSGGGTIIGNGLGDKLVGATSGADTLIVAASGSDTVVGGLTNAYMDLVNMTGSTAGTMTLTATQAGSITFGGETVTYSNIENIIDSPSISAIQVTGGTYGISLTGSTTIYNQGATPGTLDISGLAPNAASNAIILGTTAGQTVFLANETVYGLSAATASVTLGSFAEFGVGGTAKSLLMNNVNEVSDPSTNGLVVANTGTDNFWGIGGATVVVGFGGTDTVQGGGNQSVLSFEGYTGNLTASITAFSSSSSYTTLSFGGGTVLYNDIGGVGASQGTNVLTMNANSVVFIGGGGTDTFLSSGNNNTFDVGVGGTVTVDATGTASNILNFQALSSMTTGLTASLMYETASLATLTYSGGTVAYMDVSEIIAPNYSSTITGDGANDYLVGGSATNTFIVGVGTGGTLDSVLGGSGVNYLDFAGATVGIQAALNATGTSKVLTYSGADGASTVWENDIEGIIGPNYASTFTGGGHADTFIGGTANDTFIPATTGSDYFDGGAGVNFLNFAGLTVGLTATLASTAKTLTYDGTSATLTYVNVEQIQAPNYASTITGDGANDILLGGAANDTFYVAASGTDTVNGGAGTNFLNLSGLASGVTATLLYNTVAYATMGLGGESVVYTNIEGVTLPNHSSVITGDGDNDTLVGGTSGNDTFVVGYGASGTMDHVTGGSGTNYISFAGATAGTVFSLVTTGTGTIDYAGTDGASSVVYSGVQGLIAPAGYTSTLDGNGNNDKLVAGVGGIAVFNPHGNGTDTVIGTGSTTATLNFAGSIDAISAGVTASLASGTVTYATSLGTGTVVFSGVSEVVGATSFANTLSGNGSGDTMVGGSLNDTFIVGTGNDAVDGEAGVNVLSFANQSIGTLSAALLAGGGTISFSAGTVVYANIEEIVAGNVASTLTGDGASDILLGGSANDTFMMAVGGTDTVNGEGGINFIDFASLTTALHTTLSAATGTLSYTGNNSAASTLVYSNIEGILLPNAGGTVTGDGAGDTLIGGSGNNTFIVGSGSDTVVGGSGSAMLEFLSDTSNVLNTTLSATDSLSATLGAGTVTASQITGVEAPNGVVATILCNETNGLIIGGNANDTLIAGANDVTINGGIGNNNISILSTSGSDVINGGTGNNTISFAASLANLYDSTINGGTGTNTLIDTSVSSGLSILASTSLANVSHISMLNLSTNPSLSMTIGNSDIQSIVGSGAASTLTLMLSSTSTLHLLDQGSAATFTSSVVNSTTTNYDWYSSVSEAASTHLAHLTAIS